MESDAVIVLLGLAGLDIDADVETATDAEPDSEILAEAVNVQVIVALVVVLLLGLAGLDIDVEQDSEIEAVNVQVIVTLRLVVVLPLADIEDPSDMVLDAEGEKEDDPVVDTDIDTVDVVDADKL